MRVIFNSSQLFKENFEIIWWCSKGQNSTPTKWLEKRRILNQSKVILNLTQRPMYKSHNDVQRQRYGEIFIIQKAFKKNTSQ